MSLRRFIKAIALTSVLAIGFGFVAGCSGSKPQSTATPSATPSEDIISNVTITDKVEEEIKNNINFKDYEDSRAYDLAEKETQIDVKLIAPVIKYQTDVMKVDYHVKLVKAGDGSLVLELLGTDFTLPQGIKTCKVEWKSMGEYHALSEKVYRFTNLCILLDDEVYFYEETFYSPMIEGRKQTVEYLNKED